MENIGMYGKFEPMCKIRFMSEPIADEEYIAITSAELVELIRDQMKLTALEAGGVDNWSWHGESLHDYKKELPGCYGQKFYDWVNMVKPADMTAEEYIDDMDFEDFARYEVDVM